uniref:Uncharacterized protein n=1 Tax=uncultured Desulfobacterium sp. TaxID=201089 RepID=E1YE82_9BACT|nr:unknown protein [uncultured Desulfobacterium sp.]
MSFNVARAKSGFDPFAFFNVARAKSGFDPFAFLYKIFIRFFVKKRV